MTELLDAAATSRFADVTWPGVDGVARLHYHDAEPRDEPGEPPVVMLHGGGPGASAWSNFAGNFPIFAGRFRTLMPDLPGFGQSAAPPVEGNYFTFAAHAVAS